MMIERVGVFGPLRTQYGVLNHFTKCLAEAFERAGVACQVYGADGGARQSLVAEIVRDAPDLTCAFNGLLPDAEGNFLCDHIQIPHLAWLLDSPYHFFPLAKSPLTIIGCDDQKSAQFFDELGAAETLFLPHAVEPEAIGEYANCRDLDVVLLGSLSDPESIRGDWIGLSKAQVDGIDGAARLALEDETIPISQAVMQCCAGLGVESGVMLGLLDSVERYVRARDRVDLVRSIRGAEVHVFGSGVEILGDQDNVTVHPAVSYTEALSVMRRAKVLLNSCPRIRYGGHERIFGGIACGALVLTASNPYMSDAFSEGKDIAFYRYSNLGDVDGLVKSYLDDEDKRQAVVAAGQENIRQHHSYDQRVSKILGASGP